MAPLPTVTSLVLLGLAAAAGPWQTGRGQGAPRATTSYGAPVRGRGYGIRQLSSGYGATRTNSGYGATRTNSGYGATRPSSGYGAPRPSSGYGVPRPSSGHDASRVHVVRATSTGRQPVIPAPFGRRPSRPSAVQRSQATGSQLYLSWQHNAHRNGKYTWKQAHDECRKLNMQLVSLTSPQEQKIKEQIGSVAYYWTSGRRTGPDSFAWADDSAVCRRDQIGCYENWGRTGAVHDPQPDNREPGGEDCLAVLNNFYQDGIVWHDIACYHQKHFVCEQ